MQKQLIKNHQISPHSHAQNPLPLHAHLVPKPLLTRHFFVPAFNLAIGLFGFSSLSFAETNSTQLKNLIECQSNYQQYSGLTEDYEKNLGKLGWHRIENADQPFIYLYENKKPASFFGQSTHQIGLTGNAIVAIFRHVDANKLAQQHGLTQHEFFKAANYFRGEKVLRTETPQDEHIPVHHKMMLSEIPGKDPLILLGCNYELDREAMEKALADLED